MPPTRAGSARAWRTRRASIATGASAAAVRCCAACASARRARSCRTLDDDLRPIDASEPEPEPYVAPPPPPPPPPPGRDEPAWEPPREQRRVHAIPTHADLKRSRAVELFNGSRHRRTVAGVARSLGDPLVAVRPSATEGSIVSIVVGWELSWYRYEVDLADEEAGVRLVAQGAELTELEVEDQAPNAVADERGTLALAE